MNAKCSRAAFYEKDITPPVGIWLAGFGFRNKASEGVDDPLYLRIVALEDEPGRKLVIVSADILKFPKEMSFRLKKWFLYKFCLEPSSLILNSSHTHCGPLLKQAKTYPHWPLDTDYVKAFEESIKTGITEVLAGMNEASFEYGAFNSDFAVNRRLPDSDGFVKWGANEDGYCDNEIPVISVYDKDRKLKAVIYSSSCHPTSRGGYLISADYPGAISRSLKKRFGKDVQTIFLQGTGGSSKPKFYDKDTKAFIQASSEDIGRLGQKLASEISDFIASGKMKEISLNISSEERIVKFPLNEASIPSDSDLMNLLENDSSDCGTSPLTNRIWAGEVLERKRVGALDLFYNMLVNKTRLAGNLTIIGCSGEVTAEAGKIIKDAFEDGDLILLGYCFYTDAYVPTDEMLPIGGYEVLASYRGAMLSAPFAPGINNVLKGDFFRRMP